MGTQLRSHLVIRGRVGVRGRGRARVSVRVGVWFRVRFRTRARARVSGTWVAPEVVVVLRALIRLA